VLAVLAMSVTVNGGRRAVRPRRQWRQRCRKIRCGWCRRD